MNQRAIKNQLDRQTVHSTSRTQGLDKQTQWLAQWLADNHFKKNVYICFKDAVNAFSGEGRVYTLHLHISHFFKINFVIYLPYTVWSFPPYSLIAFTEWLKQLTHVTCSGESALHVTSDGPLTCSQYESHFSSYFRPKLSVFLRDQGAFCENHTQCFSGNVSKKVTKLPRAQKCVSKFQHYTTHHFINCTDLLLLSD